MNYKGTVLLVCSLLIAASLSAQEPPLKEKIARVATTPKGTQWIRFKSSASIKTEDLFKVHKAALGLTENDSMTEIRADQDKIGFTHHRFQQTHKGLEVEGAEFIVHSRNNLAEKANGELVSGLQINVQPSISSTEAVQIALSEIKAEVYMWQHPDKEQLLKRLRKNQNATYFPQGRLLITRIVNHRGFRADNFTLAYRCDVYSRVPEGAVAVYVDAHSGEIIKKVSLLRTCSSGSVATLFNGTKEITTQFDPIKERYTLEDTCRGGGVMTYYNEKEIDEKNNQWNDSDKEQRSATAHWAAEMTYDYYLSAHGRDSFDNHGALMYNNVDKSTNNNAFWDGEFVTLGEGRPPSSMNYLVSLDIVGHEWTHAVVEKTAKLEYERESGALDESFSDIFGTMVEFFGQNDTGDYLIGEDVYVGPGKFRSMSNPKAEGQPDTYGGTNWMNTSGCTPDAYNDLCGVHTNSGVQNYWFYLLAEGGSATNDSNNSFSVSSIGREKAAAIAYRNVAYYLTKSSDYFDSRTGSTWAAIDLYGLPSTEVTQVVNAWYAVDVVDGVNLVLLLSDPFDADAVYLASESITAGKFELVSPGRVLFYAGSKITLTPGFSSTPGSEFHAFINPAYSTESSARAGLQKSGLMQNKLLVRP